jgi:hypothetical protein
MQQLHLQHWRVRLDHTSWWRLTWGRVFLGSPSLGFPMKDAANHETVFAQRCCRVGLSGPSAESPSMWREAANVAVALD